MKRIVSLFSIVAILLSLFTFFPTQYASAAESNEVKPVEDVKVITEEEFNNYKKEGIFNEDDTYEEVIEDFKEGIENAPLETEGEQKLSGEPSFSIQAKKASLSGYTGAPGDILVTTDTQKNTGLTGHAGIVISTGKILQIAGPGKKIKVMTVAQWRSNYDKTNVYRVQTQSVAIEAARWAKNNYKDGSNPGYKVNTSLYSKSPTYCSKIVWQAYYYGSGSKKVMKTPSTRIATPYALRTLFYSSYTPARIIKEQNYSG